MAQVKHSKVSGKSDGADSTLVRPSDWNADHVVQFIGASVFRDSTLTINHNTATVIPFDAELYDPLGMHSLASNTERLVVPSGYDGIWEVRGYMSWNNTDPDGLRELVIRKNDGAFFTLVVATKPGSAQPQKFGATRLIDMNVGDYFDMYAYQDSGSNLAIEWGSPRTFMEAIFRGKE